MYVFTIQSIGTLFGRLSCRELNLIINSSSTISSFAGPGPRVRRVQDAGEVREEHARLDAQPLQAAHRADLQDLAARRGRAIRAVQLAGQQDAPLARLAHHKLCRHPVSGNE